MSIKKNLALLFLLFGVSFSASAATYEITDFYKGVGCNFTIGQVATAAAADCYIGKTTRYAGTISRLVQYDSGGGNFGIRAFGSGSSWDNVMSFRLSSKLCPENQQINPITGVCEDIPPCPPGYIRDEVGMCVLSPEDDFCDTDFSELVAAEVNSCALKYPDFFTDVNFTCTDRENYSLSCVQGIAKPKDPTSPINPPNGGFNPSNPDPVNPTPPDFDKPEPDEVAPNDTTDTAVLEALRNLNRDNNQAATSLNTDLNAGFSSTLDALNHSNSKLDAIGQSIVEQTNQDYLIHQANKLLQLQTTGAITEGTSKTVGAINSQTTQLKDSLDSVSAGINGLGDKLTGELNESGCNSFHCTGNAASCYLARMNWDAKCGELARIPIFNQETGAVTDELQRITQESVDENGAFKKVFTDANGSVDEALEAYDKSNGFSFSSGCPQPRTYDLGITRLTIDYQPFCTLALVFRAFLMASAALGSFFMIAKFM
ncbi:virulence factor TspB C-terminal domain-related protein [Vibrio sp. 2-2(8)]|uniref:virulence factor TspB C-terminal domain-related protein n=1 Tax=Vibrio sp. 2-2(8) TaxID=2591014 RepID=UPI001482E1EC|nr:virulence factor TspB C-terminal domain-related protein [Vibrio sp. 2-2(8)]NNN48072.1 hypothetical protein [Vibrio sp. 2-2(8)]NNN48082.1 hypothetical protein [Vibrio sp. 2-2(8)]